MADLHVCLFGDPSVEIASEPVRFPSRSASSLFAFLLVGGARRVPRSLLTGTFWPEVPEAKARRRLSHSLWQITSALGDETAVVVAERETVGISDAHTGLRVDVWEFDRLLQQLDQTAGADHFARLHEASDLVVGDLCDGLYDDWVMPARERYRERYAHLLTELVRAYKSRSDLDRALETARLVVDLNPLSEEPQREVMRLLHLLGRTADAVEHYDQLQALLADEVGAEPDARTRALLDRLISHADPAPAPESTEPETVAPDRAHLVGRDSERTQLRRALDDAIAGSGGVVLVEGEPGIGKTRLLDDLKESAEWRGFDVATVSCGAVGGPFAALLPAMTELLPRLRVLQLAETVDAIWLADLAALLPKLREWLPDLGEPEPLAPTENRSRRTEALVQAVAAGAAIRPLLLVVEDLHDADSATLAVLTGLSRVSPGTPIVVAVTFRPTEARTRADVWSTLVALEPEVRQRLSLGPLGEEAISALAFDAGFEVGIDVLRAIHRETGGNPLFALETLRAVGETELDDHSLPVAPSVHDVISRRLLSVDPVARQALEVIAVLGRPAALGELMALAPHPSVGALSGDIEDLVRRSLLAEVGDDFALPHEQVRRVVYEEIDPVRRIGMHADTARALAESSTVSNAELAWHSEAGDLIELAARHHAMAAEEAIAAAAYEAAAEHYHRAIDTGWLDRHDDGKQFDLLLGYETTLSVIGDTERRLAIIDQLEATAPDPERKGRAQLRRIALLTGLGHLDEAATSADQLVDWADRAGLDATVIAAVLARSSIHVEAGSPAEALHLLARLDQRDATTAEHVGITAARARALQMMQHHAEALDAWAEAMAAAADASDRVAYVDALGTSGVAAAESGDVAMALTRIGEALEGARGLGHQYAVARNLMNRGTVLQHNDPGQALVDYAEAETIFVSVGSRRGQAFVNSNVADLRQTLFGIDAAADTAWRAALAAFDEMGNRAEVAHCKLVAGRSAHAEGDLESARDHLGSALRNTRAAENRFTEMQVLAASARVDQATGNLLGAAKNADAAIELAHEIHAAQHLPAMFADRSAIELEQGSIDAALVSAQAAVTAVDDYSHSPHRPWWALVRAQRRGHDPAARDSMGRCWERVEHLMRNLEPEDRKRAFDLQPELAMIRNAWDADQPQVRTVELPAVDAPSGRPLTAEDHVTVLWTVSHPDDPDEAVASRRVRLIRLADEAAAQGGAPSINHLATALDISRSTVRRTLATLRDDGIEIATRGSRR